MKDYKAYGPQAWIADNGDTAIAVIDGLLKIDDNRRADNSLDIMPLMKDIAKLCDGSMIETGPYPSIFLCSRQSLLLGQIGAERARKNLENARIIITKKRCRLDPNYTEPHNLALGLLYHLRIMKLVRKSFPYIQALNVDPAKFETHILADSFAASDLAGYADENGKIKRDSFMGEHNNFRGRHFNMVEGAYECDEFCLAAGQVTVPGSYPTIMIEALHNAPIKKVIEHRLTNDNEAKVLKIVVTDKDTTFTTNARAVRNLRAFEFVA